MSRLTSASSASRSFYSYTYHIDHYFASCTIFLSPLCHTAGMNDQQMGINEIGVSFPDDTFGQGTPDTPPEKVKGKPWMYVVRDILQHSSSLADGLKGVQDSDRTCNLIVGIGDGKTKNGNKQANDGSDTPAVYGIEYSGYVANPYTDATQLPVNETWHPKIEVCTPWFVLSCDVL